MAHTVVGRYELRALVGKGSMARVVEAFDTVLQRDVAIKFLRSDAADAEGRARFLREVRVAASLSHPNVVRVYDAGEEGGRLFLVTELVHGPSIAAVLKRRGALTLRQAVLVTDRVLGALGAAHDQGLVHRDVKPSNILVGDDDRTVKLADFGLAKTLDDAGAAVTRPGQVVGTPMYLAPERSEGRTATPASDLYSLGVVLFEMLAGRPPFRGRNLLELAVAHQQAPVPPLRRPDVPEALEVVMLTALARDPASRPPSAHAMREALRSAARQAMRRPLATAS
ncbi:MAG: serine/threonine protein kinase [Actinobacteria bacterium]|nr:serine/threonine protein kinase [Actinomycetota bacterium]